MLLRFAKGNKTLCKTLSRSAVKAAVSTLTIGYVTPITFEMDAGRRETFAVVAAR
jgi:hypothetical protein